MNSEQFDGWLTQKSHPDPTSLFEKPLVMGILNVTSDSFYDGGTFLSPDKACEHAFNLIAQGADIIDVGGESTRPGAIQVPLDLELSRVVPVIEQIRSNSDICISIDTYKPEVMNAAINAGANIINDVYALRQDGALAMAAKHDVPVCLMHMQGQPQHMQENPSYPNGIITEVEQFFIERLEACRVAGINDRRLILDPGFGFGKQTAHNMELIYNLHAFKIFNRPVLLGVSRKSTIGALLGKKVSDRLIGSITMAVYTALKGVGILRTHDVDETNQALRIIEAIYQIN